MKIKFQSLCIVSLILGLGIIVPAQAAGTFEGEIYSTAGGFRFPDNSLQTTAANKLANVVTVSVSGGDYTSPIDALAAITDAAEDNPYLLKIGPGVYDLGAASLLMKPYVTIEGSGQGITIIQGNVDGTSSLPPAAAVVHGVDNATLRHLTVKNIGGSSAATAILMTGASPLISHVTAIAFGGIDDNFGISVDQSSAILNEVTASGDGDEALSVNRGVYIRESSPVLTHVTASSQGGSICTGISIVGGSDPIIKYSTINASACVTAYSITVINDSNPVIEESTLEVSGTANSIGISFAGPADPTLLLKSVTVKASAGFSTKAIIQGSGLSAHFIIINSHLEGATTSIEATAGTAKVLYSRLEGGAPDDDGIGGIFTCVGNYSIDTGLPVGCP